jgi:hypothetical protein
MKVGLFTILLSVASFVGAGSRANAATFANRECCEATPVPCPPSTLGTTESAMQNVYGSPISQCVPEFLPSSIQAFNACCQPVPVPSYIPDFCASNSMVNDSIYYSQTVSDSQLNDIYDKLEDHETRLRNGKL